ncbi:MAG: FtsW/RodA/SpoVE family cell cycle protein, partial [Pseudomonadota bacterium]
MINNFLGEIYAQSCLWWRQIDRFTVSIVLILMAVSVIMVATASPAVASRIGVHSSYFIQKHLQFTLLAIVVLLLVSSLTIPQLRLMCYCGLLVSILMLVAVIFSGYEIKGATRWLNLFGLSIQPSEFVKPFLLFVTGDLLAAYHNNNKFPGWQAAFALFAVSIMLLIMQPDFGLSATLTLLFAMQLFIAGLTVFWVMIVGLVASVGVVTCYYSLPHVANRINYFLNSGSVKGYQISKSLAAITDGGWFGKGLGEGIVKQHLPDSHTDFIFPVMVEELGLVISLIVIGLYLWLA